MGSADFVGTLRNLRDFANYEFDGLAHPHVASWWLAEVKRRRGLRHTRSYCETVLASYPRSGNHAARWLMEANYGRPTLGAGDSERFLFPRGLVDKPLFLRPGFTFDRLHQQPVAIKRHEFQPLDEFKRLIVIVRDPVDAVLSHTKHLQDKDFQEQVRGQVDLWVEHIHRWDQWHPGARLWIPYKTLTSDPAQVLNMLNGFLELGTVHPAGPRLDLSSARQALVRPAASHRNNPRDLWPQRAKIIEDLISQSDLTSTPQPWR